MARTLIGRTVRRLRQARGLTQAGLATRLGISASYLNLIEHDERAVTASLLIKLARTLESDLETLSGAEERSASAALREALTDPLLGGEPISEEALAAIAAHPAAARAVLALSRAWMAAREDASGLALPSGRRIKLPHEEARALFNDRGNHFPVLEAAAEAIRADLATEPVSQAEMNHAIAERLRNRHRLVVRVAPLAGMLRSYDPASGLLVLSDMLKRESRGFQMAFQLMLVEAGDMVQEMLDEFAPSSAEAVSVIRIGLLNYAAAALLMPYEAFLVEATALRYDIDMLAARFAVSFEQAAQRVSTLARPGQRGVPFFFLRMDPAGTIGKAFAGAGFTFTQAGGSCPLWVANTAFFTQGQLCVQVGQLPDGASYLCFAKVVTGAVMEWREPPPRHAVAMGCEVSRAPEVVYGDGLDLAGAATRIGLSCRLCDWTGCRSRASPPLAHRLAMQVNRHHAAPFASVPKGGLPS